MSGGAGALLAKVQWVGEANRILPNVADAGSSSLVPREHKCQSQCSQRYKWVYFINFSSTVCGYPSLTMELASCQSSYL